MFDAQKRLAVLRELLSLSGTAKANGGEPVSKSRIFGVVQSRHGEISGKELEGILQEFRESGAVHVMSWKSMNVQNFSLDFSKTGVLLDELFVSAFNFHEKQKGRLEAVQKEMKALLRESVKAEEVKA